MSETIVRPDVAVRDGFGPFATRLRERPCRIAYAGNSVIAQQWRVCPPLPASDAPVGSLHADHYEFARPLRPSQAMLTNPSGCRPGRFRLVHLDLAIDAGNEAVFNTGPDSVFGLLLITGPDCGRLELRIGTGSVEYQTFDRWCDRDLIRTPVFSESAPPGVTMQLRGQGQRIAGAMDADDDPTFLKLADLLLHTMPADIPVGQIREGTKVPTDASVSIIMAVRNAERFLAQALDSIAAQTFHDYELIIVDGNSTDDSLRIARSYPRTTCIQQVGSGFTGAWNEGIAASRAPYVAFLDSDDIWPAEKLAVQMAYCAEHPGTDCVVGHIHFFLEPGASFPPGFKPSLLEGTHVGYIPGVSLIRRSVFDQLGEFENRWTMTSDLVWFARLRESDARIGVLDQVMLHKRVHGGNLTYATPKSIYQRELTQLLKESLDRRRTNPPPRDV